MCATLAGQSKDADLPELTQTVNDATSRTVVRAPAAAMQTEITTDVVKATLSSTGATLVRLELLKYPDHVVHEWYEPLLELLPPQPATSRATDAVANAVRTRPNRVMPRSLPQAPICNQLRIWSG
jgi:hypothetical protein